MNDTTHAKILIIDDDRALSGLTGEYLKGNGLQVDAVYSAEDALKWLDRRSKYDLILLDIMMPGMSGIDLLPMIRSRWNIPVIMVTGRGEEIDRILGLEMGADDYVGKPCNPRELLARIRAVLRRMSDRGNKAKDEKIDLHGIQLDVGSRSVSINDTSVSLTTAEFDVLAELMRHAGEVVSREDLTRRVLHRELTPYDRSIDVHVSRVRNALRESLGEQELIITIRGIGYQFSN